MRTLQWITALAILILLGYVAVSPQLAYAPVPRIILFLLASVFPALLIATTATTQLQLEAKGFFFVTSGASAFFIALLLILNYISKPELQVVAFSVVDEKGSEVNLTPYYALQLEPNPNGLVANYYVRGGRAVMVYPEQVVEQMIRVKLSADGQVYRGVVSYAKRPVSSLRIGHELK